MTKQVLVCPTYRGHTAPYALYQLRARVLLACGRAFYKALMPTHREATFVCAVNARICSSVHATTRQYYSSSTPVPVRRHEIPLCGIVQIDEVVRTRVTPPHLVTQWWVAEARLDH